ncbi:hypothetical protein NECAME_02476 [Necator americanus]|uniref:Uncharacterized protein n=1 Tax=Necator americanus TaxID=51031 RepID=W2TG52_NECAM|nr:hypothetical protein NECAME_02476 [Necator americanus]ETN79997.1 hypothetical protein NECAME_02476 [Necator americanus]
MTILLPVMPACFLISSKWKVKLTKRKILDTFSFRNLRNMKETRRKPMKSTEKYCTEKVGQGGKNNSGNYNVG